MSDSSSRSLPIDNSYYNTNKSIQPSQNNSNNTSLITPNTSISSFLSQPFQLQTLPITQHDYADHYEFVTPLPSTFNRDQLNVSINNNMLTLSANQREKNEENGNISYSERHVSSSVSLPIDSDLYQLNARYEKGKLLIDVPRIKGKNTYSRNINIQSA